MSRLCAALFIAFQCQALDVNSLKPQGYVSDFAQVLDEQTRARINEYCGQVERATGSQIAIVTLGSLEDNSIEDFSYKLFHKWGIGKKGEDNGLMLLLAIKDHKDRIEVGYGLEPVLPDGFVGRTLDDIRPAAGPQGDFGARSRAPRRRWEAPSRRQRASPWTHTSPRRDPRRRHSRKAADSPGH